MRAYQERRNFLFKTKNTNKQPASSNSSQEGYERHNTVEGGQTHSEEAEVAYLVEEHLQT